VFRNRLVVAGVTAALLGTLIQAPVQADRWWEEGPRSTDWTLTVNWQPCQLTGGVLIKDGTLYVRARQLADCVPDMFYTWTERSKEMTMWREIDGAIMEMRMRPESPDVRHLMHLVRMDGGRLYYPDGTQADSNESWRGGEEYDLSYHGLSPYDYQGANYVSLRLALGTLDYSVGVDDTNRVINVNTNGTYYPAAWERAEIQPDHWDMLGDHDWRRLTPAVVRAMRTYSKSAGNVTKTLQAAGVSYRTDRNNFRILTYRPGMDQTPLMDYYFTGSSPYTVMWFSNWWEMQEWVGQLRYEGVQTGAAGTGVGITAGGLAWATGAAAIAVPVAGAIIGLTVLAVGAEYTFEIKQAESCITRTEMYYDAIGVGSDAYSRMTAGVILSERGGNVLGCLPGYYAGPINNVAIQF
jgi:hypothetical protein